MTLDTQDIELTSSLEDYLKAIYKLSKEAPVVRVKDIAEYLSVSPPSVSETIQKLKSLSLVEHEKYSYITFTKEGIYQAEILLNRNNIIRKFLEQLLHLTPNKAKVEACKLEHSFSSDTLKQLVLFMEYSFLNSTSEAFHKYLKDRNSILTRRSEMKIAITTKGTQLNSEIDSRFGRAQGFIIYDLEKETSEVIPNTQNLNLSHGAGIQAAQNLINAGVSVLITGNVGPKAFRVLNSSGVKIYINAKGTVWEAINAYKQGKLEETSNANVSSHN